MVTLPEKSYSRMVVVQILYSLNLSDSEIKELTQEKILQNIDRIAAFYKNTDSEEHELIEVIREKINYKFVESLLITMSESIDVIDQAIINVLVKQDSWQRMHILIKSTLRAAIAEFIGLNTGRKILIDEYVGIASSFFGGKEINFVNATLDKVTANLKQ